MNNKLRKFIKNLSYAFWAQGLSLGSSILISFVLPKFIGITAFGYWQLFIFYTTYAGFFHLGLTDGIYLRLGGKQYNQLDYSMLGSEMKCLNFFQISMGIIIALYIFIKEYEINRSFVIISFLAYMVIFNSVAYLGYIFQAVNRTRDYSIALIIEKTCCLFAMTCAILLHIDNFKTYVMIYIICDIFALFYCIVKGKKIVFSKPKQLMPVWKEICTNIKIGVKLLIANLASLLIIGFNRMLIDKYWGIDVFGKFSMAISLTNFFLIFITQISMVLFPVLRQAEEKSIKMLYKDIRKILFLILPIIFLLYFPLQAVLNIWLPQYAESFRYLILLLPICVYDGRMQLLCTTYFKVLREEKALLIVNVMAMLTSCVLGLLGIYAFNNVYIVTFAIVFSVVIRNLISEVYLGRLLDIKIVKGIAIEMILTLSFVFLAWCFDQKLSFILYLMVYLAYLFAKKKDIEIFVDLLHSVKGK